MDAVLLPHTLEFAADPYAIVREVDRVLTGEGQLLVLGFAPWSPVGPARALSRDGFPPGMRRVLSEKRVRDWLVLLGYESRRVRALSVRESVGLGLGAGRGHGPLSAPWPQSVSRRRVSFESPQARLHPHADTAALPREARGDRRPRQADDTLVFMTGSSS